VIAHVVVGAESNVAVPLLLEPFFLIDGELVWQDPSENAFELEDGWAS
jgi:hypothetical protein